MNQNNNAPIETVFFDFGGVIAEEGFLNVFMSVATAQGLDPRQVLQEAVNVAYNDGYLVHDIDEKTFWETVRQRTGLQGEDREMRNVMFDGFHIRPRMLAFVELLRKTGRKVCILSDQTNWLDELNERYGFFDKFDIVFNSWHERLHKRDPRCFENALQKAGAAATTSLFVDDATRNVEVARSLGIRSIHFDYPEQFETELYKIIPDLPQLPANI